MVELDCLRAERGVPSAAPRFTAIARDTSSKSSMTHLRVSAEDAHQGKASLCSWHKRFRCCFSCVLERRFSSLACAFRSTLLGHGPAWHAETGAAWPRQRDRAASVPFCLRAGGKYPDMVLARRTSRRVLSFRIRRGLL